MPAISQPDFFEAHPGLWAFGSALATLLTVLVGGLGIFFVWKQLRTNQQALGDSAKSAQAAADAAKSAYAGVRPWVKLEVTKAYLFFSPENPDEVGCQLDYRMENIGNTPALRAGLVFKPIPQGYGIPSDIPTELQKLHKSEPRTPRVLFPRDTVAEGLSMNFPYLRQPDESMVGFRVIAAVVYRAAPDSEVYWTPLVLGLQHETPPPDLVYRFYRGMGAVPCHVMLDGSQTPHPT